MYINRNVKKREFSPFIVRNRALQGTQEATVNMNQNKST